MNNYELYHHGILGQKWGVRRYQNSDGSLTDAGKKRYLRDDGSFTRAGNRKFTNYDKETGRRTLTKKGQKLFVQDDQLTELGKLRYSTLANTVSEMTDGEKYLYSKDLDRYALMSSELSNSDISNIDSRINTSKSVSSSYPYTDSYKDQMKREAREEAVEKRKEKNLDDRVTEYSKGVGKGISTVISDTIVATGKSFFSAMGVNYNGPKEKKKEDKKEKKD